MRTRLFALLAAVLLPFPCLADTVTYTYTGNTFTQFSGGYSFSDFVHGEFTLPTLLATNATTYFSPASFSFSDGEQSIADSNLNLFSETFALTTDSSGNVSNWDIFLGLATGGVITTQSGFGSGQFDEGSGFNGHSAAFGSSFDAGTWMVTTSTSITPEPASLGLVLTGLAGAAALLRKRLHQTN